jgi:ATP-dependent helicase/nuclease subunit A
LKEEYSSVYIDEYQDVNALQSKIFDAVSRDDNRFMVGDIKQSIYSFRSADPDVFASMKKSFPKLDAAASGSAFSIFMSKNFRSEKHIIDFVNEVFDTCFGLAGESIGYLPEDRLVFAKDSPTDANKKAFVCLVPERAKNAEDGKKTATRTDDDETQDAESAEKETEADELQCKYVAKKISEILADESANVSPKDIAIIIRKNYRMSAYAKALSELGINTKNIGDKNFFLNSEIQLALCLLNAIDNPEKDIYLAGLLASPIFNFTPDELLMISKEKKASLFKSLVSYTNENSFEKGRKFLEKLE